MQRYAFTYFVIIDVMVPRQTEEGGQINCSSCLSFVMARLDPKQASDRLKGCHDATMRGQIRARPGLSIPHRIICSH